MSDFNDLALTMVHYKQWADKTTYDLLHSMPESELSKPRQSHFGTILNTLNHIYVVDDIFKAHLEHNSHHYQARDSIVSSTLSDLSLKADILNQWYVDYVTSLSNDRLSETVRFDFVGGGKGAMTRLEIILHITNHASYHRGYVDDMLGQTDYVAKATDLPVYLRQIQTS